MVGTAGFKGVVGLAALVFAGWSGAQVVGAVNGQASVARDFHAAAGAVFVQHVAAQGGGASPVSADAVAFSSTTDVQKLAELGVVAADWAGQHPRHSAPTVSTVVFLVRKGNPQAVRGWSDLVRSDVGVVVADPRSCNNGRYAYMGAWGSVRENGGTDAQAADFVQTLFRRAKVVAKAERVAVKAFVQEGVGDVLLAFESDVPAMLASAGGAELEVVTPSVSIAVENVLAAQTQGQASSNVAGAYLDWLYTDEAQELAAQHHLRPRSAAVLARHAQQLQPVALFGVDKYFGSLALAQKLHFSEGGRFDRMLHPDAARLAGNGQQQAAPAL